MMSAKIAKINSLEHPSRLRWRCVPDHTCSSMLAHAPLKWSPVPLLQQALAYAQAGTLLPCAELPRPATTGGGSIDRIGLRPEMFPGWGPPSAGPESPGPPPKQAGQACYFVTLCYRSTVVRVTIRRGSRTAN
jgi:hypothetical protein